MRKTIFFALLSVFLAIRISFASFISIHTTTQSSLVKNKLTLNVSLQNKGDEAAYDVQAEIMFGFKTFSTPKLKKLPPDRSISFPLSHDIQTGKQGDYPLIIVTHYTDANGYPFSALSCILVSNRKDAPPLEIIGSMETARFTKTGQVKVMLKNNAENDILTSVRLIVPAELNVNIPLKQVSIVSKTQKDIVFELENSSALSDSSYQIYAVAEYDKNEFHKTVIVPGTVFIEKSNRILGIDYKAIILILVLFSLIFLIAQFKKRK